MPKIDIRHYMESHYMDDMKIEEFARATGRSLSSFNRDFRTAFAKTPGTWIQERRLDYSKTLLRDGATVAEAAEESGFVNLSHFWHSYKERFGHCPRQERNFTPVKVVVAMDSFKGSLSSIEVAETVEDSIVGYRPGVDVVKFAIADGGEGTVEAVTSSLGGERISVTVHGPLGSPVEAVYGLSGRKAVMEMSSAAGLTLVPEKLRNPLKTSTFGVGEIILDALGRGVDSILLGIGGSATNDAGLGMLSALGAKFFDKNGQAVVPVGATLCDIDSIDLSGLDKRLGEVKIQVACDVDSPFCGPDGPAYVFGPQKGADTEAVLKLDDGLRNVARVIRRQTGIDLTNMKSAGAAGGLGGALVSLLRATLRPGAELVLDAVGFDKALEGASLVITGEGCLDAQTAHGKAPMGVLRHAEAHGIKTVAVAGLVKHCPQLDSLGFERIVQAMPDYQTVEDAMKESVARRNIHNAMSCCLDGLL